MLFQAFFSRSHANWAAIAYIPSTILIAIFIEKWSSKFRIYYYFSLGISFFVLVLLPILAYSNFKYDPFKKMRGWEETALQVSTIYSK